MCACSFAARIRTTCGVHGSRHRRRVFCGDPVSSVGYRNQSNPGLASTRDFYFRGMILVAASHKFSQVDTLILMVRIPLLRVVLLVCSVFGTFAKITTMSIFAGLRTHACKRRWPILNNGPVGIMTLKCSESVVPPFKFRVASNVQLCDGPFDEIIAPAQST